MEIPNEISGAERSQTSTFDFHVLQSSDKFTCALCGQEAVSSTDAISKVNLFSVMPHASFCKLCDWLRRPQHLEAPRRRP